MASKEDRNRFLAAALLFVFGALVAAQPAAGALVLLGNEWGIAGAILVNATLILAYVVTRTVPLLEETQEPAEVLGIASKAVEIASPPLLIWMWRAAPSVRLSRGDAKAA